MGIYFVHELTSPDPDRAPIRDLDPYIPNDLIVKALRDKGVTDVQQEILNQLIDEGEAIGHSRVNKRYSVPFAAPYPKDFLSAVGYTIAYHIWLRGAGGPPESYVKLYEIKDRWLRDVRDYKNNIDGVVEIQPSDDSALIIGSVNRPQLTLGILQEI